MKSAVICGLFGQVIPSEHRETLLSKYTSRHNKIWCAIGWKHFHDWHLEWKWKGEPFRSRLMFQFEPDGDFIMAKSYEEDVWPKLKWDNPKKKRNEGS